MYEKYLQMNIGFLVVAAQASLKGGFYITSQAEEDIKKIRSGEILDDTIYNEILRGRNSQKTEPYNEQWNNH